RDSASSRSALAQRSWSMALRRSAFARLRRRRRKERRLHAARCENRRFIWSMLIGPSGDQGGMNWGTAFDGERIHVSITNHHHIPYKLTQNGMLTDETSTGGSCAALDPKT